MHKKKHHKRQPESLHSRPLVPVLEQHLDHQRLGDWSAGLQAGLSHWGIVNCATQSRCTRLLACLAIDLPMGFNLMLQNGLIDNRAFQFHHLSVLWFHDWWAQAIGHAKKLDISLIVDKGMLLREIEVKLHLGFFKNSTLCVKSIKGNAHWFKGWFGNNAALNQVAKFEKCCKAAHHLIWHMLVDCWQINL